MPTKKRKPKPGGPNESEAEAELRRLVPSKRLDSNLKRLARATRAYERDRYREAITFLRPIVRDFPDAWSAHELLGLCLYREGKWKGAIAELELCSEVTGSYDQHPVIADCYRALGKHKETKQVWQELRQVAPSPEIMAEGRIVYAGSLCDQGKYEDAIALLKDHAKSLRSPKPFHIRQWYALADILEQVGDHSRARKLFERVAQFDPDLGDVQARIKALK